MDEAPGNPLRNRLAAGLTDETVRKAVEGSGYPLQTVVAANLRSLGFSITEEWVFSDSDSGLIRALDIHASRPLYDLRRERGGRVRPELAILVECKRSDMPYIFFASETRPGHGGLATPVAGLHEDRISIQTDDDMSTWSFSTVRTLDLAEHPFVAEPPHVALSFTKAARKGKDVTVSGSDPYQSLVLPLTKALGSYAARVAPPETAVYFDLVMPIGLAVIDGPMILATVSPSGVEYELNPWIRVYRHDVAAEAGHRFEREKLHAIDCVHSSWLDNYVTQHLQPFADEFGRRALRHGTEIATGAGFVSGMNRDSHTDLERRLRPRQLSDLQGRPRRFLSHLRTILHERRSSRSR
jgi:hypothetical protein